MHTVGVVEPGVPSGRKPWPSQGHVVRGYVAYGVWKRSKKAAFRSNATRTRDGFASAIYCMDLIILLAPSQVPAEAEVPHVSLVLMTETEKDADDQEVCLSKYSQ